MTNKEKLENWKKIDIEKIIENLDHTEIHKLQAFTDYGSSVYVWADGEISTLGQGTTPNTDEWYAVLDCWGRGNIDEGSYAEGWAEEEKNEDDCWTGNYIETETGKVMAEDEMISECIETGEWIDYEQSTVESINRQYAEGIQNLEDMIDQEY